MSIFKKIAGVIGNTFKIGGPTGPIIKNNSGTFEVKNTGDSAFAALRALSIQSGANLNDLVALISLKGYFPLIEFDFDGATAPAAGANTGKFCFCHTTGGSYTQGDVVYDNGAALLKMPTEVVRGVMTTTAVSGSISFIQNGIYARSGTNTFTLKGDGGSTNTAHRLVIEIPYDYQDATVDSTAELPNGARVLKVSNDVATAFDGAAPTLEVKANGSTPLTIMATTDSDLKNANQYDNEDIQEIDSDSTGVVRVSITPDSSTQGAGKVIVEYTTPGA